MRILHSLSPARFGGLEEVVARLVFGLKDRGHDLSVVATVTEEPKGHPFLQALDEHDVEIHVVCVPNRGYWTESQTVYRLIREIKPVIVHTHGYRPAVLHALALRRLGIPLFTTLHGFTGGNPRNRIYEAAQLWSARRYDAVIAVSRSMLPRIKRFGVRPENTHVVPNAWAPSADLLDRHEARLRLGVEPDRFHIGWVGRLSSEKGPDIFLDACSRLEGLGATASVIGEGRSWKSMSRKVSAQRTRMDVRLHGLIPQAFRLLSSFDVLALTSRTEGTPIVILEAMFAGIPIVASEVGGVPDMLDAETAILVPPNDPGAVAHAIKEVKDHPAEARQRAVRARRRLMDEFAIDPWLDRHEALYAALVERS